MNQTSNYYNQHAQAFFENTYQVEMESLYAPFLRYLPEQALILDLGCGSGRDTLAFKKKGYQVEAIDYSTELVEKARELTGIEVRQQSFYELNEVAKYDGIWACASLLHCERDRLTEVLARIFKALKPNGVCYMSFKYGDTDREKEGRSFTDLNEQQAYDLLKQIDQALLLQQWITVDKRPDRTEEWVNVIWKKQSHAFDYYPQRLYNRAELMKEPSLIPAEHGIYFWWFKTNPPGIPTKNCITYQEYTLLYVGISPDKKTKPNSKSNLRIRLKTHFAGNAEGSMLRRTLGILLAEMSGYPLRRVGTGNRMTFTHSGEQWLDAWLEDNAYVSWIICEEPWNVEEKVFEQTILPLNLKGNQHEFKETLSAMRKKAIQNAKIMEIATEAGLQRQVKLQHVAG